MTTCLYADGTGSKRMMQEEEREFQEPPALE